MKNKSMIISITTAVVITVSIAAMALVNEIRTNPDLTLFGGALFLFMGLEVLGYVVLFMVLSKVNSEKKLDERQLKVRGDAALSTLLSTVLTAVAIAVISHLAQNFILTATDSGIIISLTSVVTFLISSDINDVYISYGKGRVPVAAVFLTGGLICLVLSGALPFNLPKPFSSEFNIVTFVLSVLFFITGTELIVKGALEKKEALADEES